MKPFYELHIVYHNSENAEEINSRLLIIEKANVGKKLLHVRCLALPDLSDNQVKSILLNCETFEEFYQNTQYPADVPFCCYDILSILNPMNQTISFHIHIDEGSGS